VLKVVPIERKKKRKRRKRKKKRRKRVASLAKRTRLRKRTRKRRKMGYLAHCLVERRNRKKYPPSPTFPLRMDEPPLLLYSVLRNLPNHSVFTVFQPLEYRLLLLDFPTTTLVILYMSNEPFIDLVTLSSPMLVDLYLSKS